MGTQCEGSGARVGISVGQERFTAGAVRANQATNVRCPVCRREFGTARVAHTDHGIQTGPRAIVPRHNV